MKLKVSFCVAILLLAASARAELTKEEAQKMLNKSGCAACHNIDTDKIGPAYKSVAEFYKTPSDTTKAFLKGEAPIDYLMKKIRAGTKSDNRHWTKSKDGKKSYGAMPPNTSARINDADLKSLLQFILSQ